jgi:hypothetical protein
METGIGIWLNLVSELVRVRHKNLRTKQRLLKRVSGQIKKDILALKIKELCRHITSDIMSRQSWEVVLKVGPRKFMSLSAEDCAIRIIVAPQY